MGGGGGGVSIFHIYIDNNTKMNAWFELRPGQAMQAHINYTVYQYKPRQYPVILQGFLKCGVVAERTGHQYADPSLVAADSDMKLKQQYSSNEDRDCKIIHWLGEGYAHIMMA